VSSRHAVVRPDQQRAVGQVAIWIIFAFMVADAATTTLGLLALKSPNDLIGDPFVSPMEALIILMMPPMAMAMVALHVFATPRPRSTASRSESS
jgi:hypothetical protein